jgi:hypothetical protein
MLKVLRMMRQSSVTRMIEQRIGRAIAILLRTLGMGLLLLHLVASIFHWIALQAMDDQAVHEKEKVDLEMGAHETDVDTTGPKAWVGQVTWIESSNLEDAPRLQR